MSIIYEALKKVENQKKPLKIQPGPDAFTQINKRTREKLKSPKKNKLPWFLGLVCVSGFFLFMIKASLSEKSDIRSFMIENNPGGAIQITEKKPEKVKAAFSSVQGKNRTGEYKLEGIVYDSQDPFVIINGRILKKEDKLDELVVIDITDSEVKLFNPEDNSKITLGISF